MSETDVTMLSVGMILILEVVFMVAMQSSTRFEALMTSIWDVVVHYTGEPIWRALSGAARALEGFTQAAIDRVAKR